MTAGNDWRNFSAYRLLVESKQERQRDWNEKSGQRSDFLVSTRWKLKIPFGLKFELQPPAIPHCSVACATTSMGAGVSTLGGQSWQELLMQPKFLGAAALVVASAAIVFLGLLGPKKLKGTYSIPVKGAPRAKNECTSNGVERHAARIFSAFLALGRRSRLFYCRTYLYLHHCVFHTAKELLFDYVRAQMRPRQLLKESLMFCPHSLSLTPLFGVINNS